VQKLSPEEKLKLETTKQDQKAPRAFHGFITKLIYNNEGLSVETEIRYEKLDARKIVEKRMQIEHRLADGTPVYNRPDKAYRYGWFDTEEACETQKLHQESEVHHYQKLPDGSELEISPFQRVGNPKSNGRPIQIAKTIPSVKVDEYLVESVYQLWSDNIPALQQIAEDLTKHDQVAYFPDFSFGGYIVYHAFISPTYDQGNFQLQMNLARIKKSEAMTHMMPLNGAAKELTNKPKATVQNVLTTL